MDIAKRNNVFISADSQSSSQLGNLAKFSGSNLLTPTEREARLYTGSLDSESRLARTKSYRRIRGRLCDSYFRSGWNYYLQRKRQPKFYFHGRISALNKDPKRCGRCGRSLLVSTALALSAGASIWEFDFDRLNSREHTSFESWKYAHTKQGTSGCF